MNGLIRFSLRNWHAVIVFVLTLVVVGGLILSTGMIPVDILPVFKSPAVQVLTFYSGMPATNVANDITNRMERWTGQTPGKTRQESRSIVGASIIRNYFREDVDPNGALTQANSLASAAIPNLPPGTLPPVILPFDPTGVTPVCIVALDWPDPPPQYNEKDVESLMYDAGRYEVRNFIMNKPGAVAPVVYGGRLRAVLAYLNREQMQMRDLTALDVMRAIDNYNLFLPTGDLKAGDTDYALDSNAMYTLVQRMGDIPVKTVKGKTVFLKDVARPEDTSFIQTNVVRVNGKRQVYIPVYRQTGSSTLSVVNAVKDDLKDMQAKMTHSDINLKLVMDQSVYVRHSIQSLATEGVLGAVLCSLVILIFLGEWRMTLIAVLTIPISVLAATIGLYATGQTINVMTLAGLSLAIGPLVDSAIICLENTHRHLGLGARRKEAAFFGASEVAMPELVASCCTLLVLAPLALMPGLGRFLFQPMALAVAFAMTIAYVLSRTFVPALCSLILKSHGHAPAVHGTDREHRAEHENPPPRGPLGRLFRRWEGFLDTCIAGYVYLLNRVVMRARLPVVLTALGALALVLVGLGTQLRREFFPEVDAGAFEMYVRAPTGTRIEVTEGRIKEVEKFVKDKLGEDQETIISEIGVVPDWSAAYTPNAGPMDAVVKVQLTHERHHSAQEYVQMLRDGFRHEGRFSDLEFAFDAGGMIRSAMNEGKSTPINIRITGKHLAEAHRVAEAIMNDVKRVDGVVDCRILQRLDYPEYVVNVDQAKASSLGLNQMEVMRNLVAALNSSVQFNKRNFWIDPITHNQYYVGVQYPEESIQSVDTLLDIPINSSLQKKAIPLRQVATVERAQVPAEVTHTDLQPTIDLTMGVQGRDLGHVADSVARVINRHGKKLGSGVWAPYDPAAKGQHKLLPGSKIEMSGEYSRMQATFKFMGGGLVLASLLVYFLMVALFRSWLTPLVILSAVPIGLVGVIIVLFVTGTALNVQSLLGVIFMVGIVVSNTVLLVDFAQNLRKQEGLSPTEAIKKAASIRVRPVVMTALAAFFALVPMSLGLERGSEANVPLGRAVIGGLLAGLVTTLIVVPALYSLVIRDRPTAAEDDDPIPEDDHPRHLPAPAPAPAVPMLAAPGAPSVGMVPAPPPDQGGRDEPPA
ncbi:MAG TPA: efflux RND transporter permease subunit [Gemmataceae bacterium]|nr:efflux RND transporter permease subunit [Gemmataceae bacterium]